MPGRKRGYYTDSFSRLYFKAKFAKDFEKFAKSQPYHLRNQVTLINPFFCIIGD